MSTRPASGRPKFDNVFLVRFTKDLRDRLDRAAVERETTIAEIVRTAVRRDLEQGRSLQVSA